MVNVEFIVSTDSNNIPAAACWREDINKKNKETKGLGV